MNVYAAWQDSIKLGPVIVGLDIAWKGLLVNAEAQTDSEVRSCSVPTFQTVPWLPIDNHAGVSPMVSYSILCLNLDSRMRVSTNYILECFRLPVTLEVYYAVVDSDILRNVAHIFHKIVLCKQKNCSFFDVLANIWKDHVR